MIFLLGHMSAPQKITITFSRRLALVLVLVGTVSTGAVVGLVYAPGSPGLPFVSPTYQAQKAPFQYQGISLDAAVYDVWYVPDTTTLILAVMAAFPNTHFFGVGAVGLGYLTGSYQTNSPQGNFSTLVYINNEMTFLVFPGNLCPDTGQIPSTGLVINVQLVADSPPGILSFQYTCLQTLAPVTLTLGNPHVIVTQLIPPSQPPPCTSLCTGVEALNLESYSFTNSSTNVILYIRNTGSASISLSSYYVKDSSGNEWALTNWTGPNINVNTLETAGITIGSSCTSCVYSGSSGAFTQFTAGNSYTITVVTARNNQFAFTVVR